MTLHIKMQNVTKMTLEFTILHYYEPDSLIVEFLGIKRCYSFAFFPKSIKKNLSFAQTIFWRTQPIFDFLLAYFNFLAPMVT
jgi:hypothetical protein